MRKITTLVAISACLVLFSSFTRVEKLYSSEEGISVSEDTERSIEREMLNSIAYIEVEEEIDIDFDPYFHLPTNFNAYEGMELDLNDIEYIEVEELVLDF